MTAHQCVIALTWDAVNPYRAQCRCGWISSNYLTIEDAGETVTRHCSDAMIGGRQ